MKTSKQFKDELRDMKQECIESIREKVEASGSVRISLDAPNMYINEVFIEDGKLFAWDYDKYEIVDCGLIYERSEEKGRRCIITLLSLFVLIDVLHEIEKQ